MKKIATLTLGLCLGMACVAAQAQTTGKADPYTQGAKSGQPDPYTDGAKSGKPDPYSDGAKSGGRFDPYTQGASQSTRAELTGSAAKKAPKHSNKKAVPTASGT